MPVAIDESTLQLLTANLAGKVRREEIDGREFLVAPLTLLVQGVLNGSKGPLFYPTEEIAKDPTSWNGMPIVVNHPTDDRGNAISARSPQVWRKQGIGHVYEAVHNSKLRAEGWFDVIKTRKVEPRILQALEAGKPVELSTGLFTDNVLAQNGSHHKGVPYTYVARNYRPDHLAILLDKKGACSVNDGCGVLVNDKGEPMKVQNADGNSQQHGDLESCSCGGETGCDCSACKGKKRRKKGMMKTPLVETPIKNFQGGEVPQPSHNQLEGFMPKLTEQERAAVINNLVANCDCVKGEKALTPGVFQEEDRPGLNQMSDDRLNQMEAARVKTYQALTANQAAKVEPPKPAPAPTGNAEAGKTQTDAEWLASAPAGIRSVVTNAMKFEAEQKASLIGRIVANANNPFSKEFLATKPMEELQGLALLAGGPSAPQGTVSMFSPNYSGAAGGPVRNRLNEGFADEDADMAPPTINWQEEVKNRQRA